MLRVSLIFMLFVFASSALGADEGAAAPDFSKYPQTEAFKAYLKWQTDPEKPLADGDMLRISAFAAEGHYALEYVVTAKGEEFDERHVYNHAHQASRQKQLSAADLEKLRAAIRELPKESETPPMERLVIVSFPEKKDWVTRSYDSKKLPKAMAAIYEVLGERFETKREQAR